MNDIDFSFEPAPWELALENTKIGDRFSALQLLTLLEGENEDTVEVVFQYLESRQIGLDTGDLPADLGSGSTALRLRTEAQLVQQGKLPEGLEENDPLRLYLEELAGIPACGDPQVLAMEAAQGREDAQALLVNVSLYRVIETAKAFAGKGVLLLDLIQEGSLGLWESVLRYESGDFEAYSDWWIRQYMAKAMVLQALAGGVGQKIRRAAEDYRSVDERLLTELGRNPTLEEIAEGLHLTAEETLAVAKMLESARVVEQAKAPAEEKEESEEDDQAVEDTAYFQSRQRIADMLSGLTAQEAELLNLRFGLEGGLPLSPEDTGKRLGLTPQEVVAMEASALAKLRKEGQ